VRGSLASRSDDLRRWEALGTAAVREAVERYAARLPSSLQPAWRLTARTVIDAGDDRVPGLAAEAAFFAVLSLPPLLLAVLGAVGYMPIDVDAVQETIAAVASQVLRPETIEEIVDPIVQTLLEDGQAEVLSIGMVFALWSGSRATGTYITAITTAYDLDDPRPAWRRRLLAFSITVTGAIIGAVLLPALVVGPRLVAVLVPRSLGATVERFVAVLYWPIAALIAVAVLASLYHVGVPWRTPWRRDVPGALLAMGLWLAGSLGLRYYADVTLRGEGSLFTGIAAPLVILLWLYVTSFAVLLGAELNAEIEKLWPHASEPVRDVERSDGSVGSLDLRP
jgi:membrane protein